MDYSNAQSAKGNVDLAHAVCLRHMEVYSWMLRIDAAEREALQGSTANSNGDKAQAEVLISIGMHSVSFGIAAAAIE